MKQLIDALRDMGCDMDGAMDRFLDDTELYYDCFASVLNDPAFEDLGTALKEGRVEEAFDAAHTLKGIISNMGLTPLLDILADIVEPLREGNGQGLLPIYNKMMDETKKYKAFLE